MIWAAIFNFIAPIIGMLQVTGGEITYSLDMPFYFCFGFNHLSFIALSNNQTFINSYRVLYIVTVIAISLVSTVGLTTLSVFASQGKRKPLIAMSVIYLVDWMFIPAIYLIGRFALGINLSEQCWLAMGFHAVITFFIFMAFYYYREVIQIERRFTKVQPVKEEEK